MPKPLAGDLRMNARGEQVGGMGVPQIMKTNAGQSFGCKKADPFMCDASRLQRAAIGLCYYEGPAIRSLTNRLQFLGLPQNARRSDSSTTVSDSRTFRVLPDFGSL